MSEKTVLILAAGEQRRWEKNMGIGYKQLLNAGDETILGRIVRQVNQRGYTPHIITHRFELMLEDADYIFPSERRWKVESLLYIKSFFTSVNLVLLGDVIYQEHVMNRIFGYKGIDMFFGNYAEIFAWYFNNNVNISMFLHDTIMRCKKHEDKGTLHSLLRAYMGDFTSPNIERQKDSSPNFTHVTGDGGWTRDIDTPEDYDMFIKQVIMTGKLDDLP
jgi:choline kinase